MNNRTQKKKSDITKKKPGKDSERMPASREKELKILSEDDLIIVTGGTRAFRNVEDQA